MSRALSSAVEEPFSQVHVALHAANLCPSPDTQCEFKGLFLFVFPGITFRKARVQRHRTDWELGTPPGIISYLNFLVSLGQRSGATTQEPTARLTLPAQARFPQAVSRMGFCLLHSPQTAGFAHPGVTGSRTAFELFQQSHMQDTSLAPSCFFHIKKNYFYY